MSDIRCSRHSSFYSSLHTHRKRIELIPSLIPSPVILWRKIPHIPPYFFLSLASHNPDQKLPMGASTFCVGVPFLDFFSLIFCLFLPFHLSHLLLRDITVRSTHHHVENIFFRLYSLKQSLFSILFKYNFFLSRNFTLSYRWALKIEV